jgi:fused signal recognition particle receptor
VSLFGRLGQILKRNDSSNIEEVEEFLIENNFGVEFTDRFISEVRDKHVKDIQQYLKDEIKEILSRKDFSLHVEHSPAVILFVGTNGSGKTTSMAKIANLLKEQGKKVMLVAGDTFRAAASEQLAKWAKVLNVPLVRQNIGSDPGAVVFDGLESAISRKMDVVLVDSAGRVETKKNLLNELSKVERIIEKKVGHKPDETLLVLDAYTGQNGLSQIEVFSKIVDISGIVLTKMDGSSGGGIVVPIVNKYNIPVKFIGTGESIKDIEFFSAETYLKLLI